MLNEMCPRHEILWHLLPIDLSYYIYSFGVPGILFFLLLLSVDLSGKYMLGITIIY